MTLTDEVHFLVTNRIPRRAITNFIAWFGKIENPIVRGLSIGAWRAFGEVDLAEARKERFDSLHDAFIRELKPGARTLDAREEIVVSPCDAQVGACGSVDGDRLIQAKGFDYTLEDLLIDPALVARYTNAQYVTLRLTASMYHRFHAPHDLTVSRVDYVSGDTWNTNPITLRKVQKLFCKNERAIVRCRLSASDHELVLVPVASILVACIRLHCLPSPLHLRHKGPNRFEVSARYAKGEEMGWFELGSTILVFAPRGMQLMESVTPGRILRQGEPLFRLPGA
jgi:phosphatidylserine decarboxylase